MFVVPPELASGPQCGFLAHCAAVGRSGPHLRTGLPSPLRFRTGANLYDPGVTCKCCQAPTDPTGNHALCCSAAGVYRRHNHVQNFLYTISQEVGWALSLEEVLPGTQTRPADVILSSLDTTPTAVDVPIVHPLHPSGQTIAGSAQPGTTAAKTTASAAVCAERHWLFRSFGLEVTGALGPQATRLMKRACHCLSVRSGGSYGDAAAYLFGASTLPLQKGEGRCSWRVPQLVHNCNLRRTPTGVNWTTTTPQHLLCSTSSN
jgi:hypothetical protein